MEKDKKSLEELFENTTVKKIEVEDELKKSFISYAMAVNVSRAIPDVRDGLKPVHRRILYSMGELNNFADKPYKKCARIVGEVMGKYHPHGDSSVYDALVRLAQDFSIREPLVDGHGNFGSVDGDSPAAQRYTEARLSPIAAEMLKDIDKDTVDFYPNFDETLMQPRVLPAKFPNLLVNGADGIAVGMATNIPPHNLVEVINGVQALIDNPDIDIDELIKIIPAPDYPTGGIVMGRTAVKHAYRTGRGGIVVRGRAEIVEEGNRQRIIITELPYQVNKARFIMQMADMVKNKRLEGISDIKEESDRDGMRVVVDVKKDANAQVVLNMLYKHTMLQQSSGIIFLALVGREPRILNLKEILYYYLEHQKDVLTRKTKFDLARAEERAHIVKGLVIALANIDEVIKIIKNSADKPEAMQKLMEKSIIRGELEEVKQKYGTPRRTEISIDMGGIDVADLIEKEEVVISMTHQGYVKRMSASEYKAQHRGGVGITAHKTKDEDFVEKVYATNSHADLLMFSNQGKVYSIKAYEVPEASRQAKGRAMINLVQLSQDEKISEIVPIPEERDLEGSLIMATKNGLIKKTKVSEYENIRKSGKIAIKLNEGDELIGVGYVKEDAEVLIASSSGKCARFNEKDVRQVGRDSMGVKSMTLEKGESVVSMAIIKPESVILTISENGYGKRTPASEFRLTSRGTKGVKAGVFNEKTGGLVGLADVEEDKDLMLIADNGVSLRTPIKDISLIGRVSQGVRVMKLRDGAKLVAFAVTEHEEQDESEQVQDGQLEDEESIQTSEPAADENLETTSLEPTTEE